MADAKASKDIRLKRLNPSDDPRTQLSKLISWILRRGAAEAGVKQDPQTKWVKFSDLCAADVLKEHTSDSLWQIIVDFNGRMDGKGPRYEINDGEGGPFIRAYTREQRSVLQDAPVDGKTKDGQVAGAAGQAMNPMNPYMNPMMMMYSMSNMYMWQQAVAAQGKYMGVVKSLNMDKGFGFIECQQTKVQYDRDVFLTRQQLTSLSGLQVGSYVNFEVEVNKQGMPQAKNITVLPVAGMPMTYPAGNKGKGKGKDGKGKGKGKDGKGEGKKGKGKGKEDKKARKEAAAKEKKERAQSNAANTEFISMIALNMK